MVRLNSMKDIKFMEVKMKSIAKIICCSVVLAWMCGATAEEEEAAAGQVSTGESQVVETPPGATADPNAGAAGAASAPAAAAPDDVVVPTPPAPRITVMPHEDKVDQTRVEQRLQDKATRTKKRTAEAEKDAAERAGKQSQGQTAPAPNGQ
jgi:hypothetical protein